MFIKENIGITNKHMTKCSTLLFSKKMQIEATMRYYYSYVGMAKI